MLPSIWSKDLLLVSHLQNGVRGGIGRGDVVMAISPTDPSLYVAKRILAVVQLKFFSAYD